MSPAREIDVPMLQPILATRSPMLKGSVKTATQRDEAARIDGSDPARPRALLALANALKGTDPSRVWDATFDAVKAANSAEGFSGEDGELVIQFQSKGQSSVHSSDVSEFDLEGIFKDLATQDYDRAVEMARAR